VTITLPSPAPICVTSWIGGYPFREVPHPTPDVLARVLVREGFGGAWVGHLSGAFFRDPGPSNDLLDDACAPYATLMPAPIVRPDWPQWERQLADAVHAGAQAVRVYPGIWGLGAHHPALAALAEAAALAGAALHVTCRFEDPRQRHRADGSSDVDAATLRFLLRRRGQAPAPVVVIAGAGRELIEEVFWGLTPEEQSRAFFDFHWVWGPPEDHFSHLVRTVGASHLAWSSWWPLRLTQHARALVDLTPSAVGQTFADGNTIAERAVLEARSLGIAREPAAPPSH
jgi:hypothetical protein